MDLPLDQVMALAQIPEVGLPERQLPHRMGMAPAEVARIRGTLLRRRLIRRDPPGPSRARSRLFLTERGRDATRWLEQLQESLPGELFVEAEPLLQDSDEVREARDLVEEPSRPWAPWRRRQPRDAPAELKPTPSEPPEDSTFERGLLNVWIGTGLFVVAFTVGVLWGTERAGLTALGMGVLIALAFMARAAAQVVRRYRSRPRSMGPIEALRAARRRPSRPVRPTHPRGAAH